MADVLLKIGQRCNIHHTALLGDEGFGYAHDGEGWQHRVHNFGVTIGDYVDIGAYTVIHRGRWRDTQVGKGTKIDAHVFLAHNVVVGERCLLIAGVTLAGSVTVGDEAIIGANATAVVGVTIGESAIIGAGAVVTKDVPAGQVWAGSPARYLRDRLPGETL